ncbi:protein translocase SEC61 complex subunit gamma [Candidatus Pacearchaeota archaeon]|jgi:protein transport protein SEC61 subunit gamma-like protein|nr:protein translocase SEC61 complex subunit gamma [Candidatus Pacearchaeota archaeon]|tara:strand:+ start:12703 stop:12879 length:177 start_codon:yes stop_codon:yes gene_type:complete
MELWNQTKSFSLKCKRVWLILKKPTRKEFETITKVSAVGIAVLGLLGFLISTVMKAFV